MAELPQRTGLPEKPYFGPAGRLLETSTETLGRWERQLADVMEELWAPGCAARRDCGQSRA